MLRIVQSGIACKEVDVAAVVYSMALPSRVTCITTLGHSAHNHQYGAKADFAVHDGGMQAA